MVVAARDFYSSTEFYLANFYAILQVVQLCRNSHRLNRGELVLVVHTNGEFVENMK